MICIGSPIKLSASAFQNEDIICTIKTIGFGSSPVGSVFSGAVLPELCLGMGHVPSHRQGSVGEAPVLKLGSRLVGVYVVVTSY